MSKPIVKITEPSAEVMQKIVRARQATAEQPKRYVKCPYCQRTAFAAYPSTSGFIETKCKKCGRIVVFDTLSMRRTRNLFPVKGR